MYQKLFTSAVKCMKRHESRRSLTVELAPVPICSSVPAMFLLKKIEFKCFDEWRNFCNSLGLGFFLFFSHSD